MIKLAHADNKPQPRNESIYDPDSGFFVLINHWYYLLGTESF